MTTPTRLVYELPIEVLWPDGHVLHCRTHDIDHDGLTITSPLNAKANTPLKLHFKLLIGSTPQPITCQGVVNMSYLVGEENLFHLHLRFKNLEPQQLQYLETFIRHHKRG